MKKNLLIILLIVISQFIVTAQANDTALNKLRTTYIKGSKIILQSTIDEKLAEVAVKINPEHYYLKKGALIAADSIYFETNKTSQIIAVSLFYNTTSDYANEVDLFNKKLGVIGKEFQFSYNGIDSKITKWEDDYTILELVEVKRGETRKLHSTLYDKDMYFRKVKAGIDFSKDENCVEILKRLGVI